MKNIFKISTLLLLALLFTVSSCKKEDETPLINGCTYPTACNFNALATIDNGSCTYPAANADCSGACLEGYISVNGSCIMAILGCTDVDALNYTSLATSDDGSCVFAYDIAQGVWNITPDCEEYTVPVIGTTISLNDQLPETFNIQGAGGNSLFIEIGDTQVNGTIDNDGNITVPNQTVSVDMGFGPMDIDIEGDGVISSSTNGFMNLTYSFEIPIIGGEESLDCSIILDR
ncbi:MAG: hypothetical protein H8E55_42130 [Pelagibacterales bacterium]|nr:hypothetical protein [Pelagibacterales bacterium]